MEECKITGCSEKEYKIGLCEKHYQELVAEASTNLANREVVKLADGTDMKEAVGVHLEVLSLRTARSLGKLVTTYKSFTNLDEQDVCEIYLKKADSCEKKGQYNKAVSLMQKVIKLKPEDTMAYYRLGFDYEKIRMNDEAIDAYIKSIKFDAENLNSHYRLGMLYSWNESYNEALTHLKKALELGPEFAEVHYRLGIVYDKKKKYTESIECFNKAIEIDPVNIRFYKSLGFTYDSNGMHEESITCFKKAIELEDRF